LLTTSQTVEERNRYAMAFKDLYRKNIKKNEKVCPFCGIV